MGDVAGMVIQPSIGLGIAGRAVPCKRDASKLHRRLSAPSRRSYHRTFRPVQILHGYFLIPKSSAAPARRLVPRLMIKRVGHGPTRELGGA